MESTRRAERRIPAELLDRYIAGTCDATERARVLAWLGHMPDGMLHEVFRLGSGIASAQTVAALERVRDAIESGSAEERGALSPQGISEPRSAQYDERGMAGLGKQPLREALPPRTRRFGAVSASFAVLSVLALVSTGVIVKWQFDGRQALLDTPLATYVTGNAERARVELRDGTVVTLNAGTNLSISRDFGRKNRDVHLRYGQAYFQVARSSGTPFVVDVAGNRTTVLGTTFGVRAYSPDTVQVAVREGKVAFNGAVLTNNDIATATLAHGVQVAHAQKVDGLFGFVTGRLVLDEVTLSAAVPELERWYDVKIRFDDPSIGSRHITAVLMSGSPRDLVDILQAIFGISVVRDGRTLTLHTMEHGR